MLPSQKNKTPPSCSYPVWMLPSQCHIAESKEMVYNSMLYALTLSVKLENREKYKVKQDFENDRKKIGLKQQHPDATLLMVPS